MKYLVVLFIILSSCSRFRLHTEHPVYLDKVNQIIEITKSTLVQQGIYTEEQVDVALKNNYVPIYGIDAYKFECVSSFQCHGEFAAELGVYTITYAAKYADWEVILGHEFLHFFDHTIVGIDDFMHKRKEIFEFGCRWAYPEPSDAFKLCQKESAEGRIRAKLRSINELNTIDGQVQHKGFE